MRRLIVCADGTWNRAKDSDRASATSTNVEKMQHAIKAVDKEGVSQIVYYHSGVGTGDLFDKLTGGALGKGIDGNILDCYKFLVNNYNAVDDEIYLFGFSRGAYTVRSLAGLIRNSGLLRQQYAGMAKEAFSLYRDRDVSKHPRSEGATKFRETFSHEGRRLSDGTRQDSTPIKCIGVWDTVGALGIPLGILDAFNHHKYSFHDTTLSSRVEFAFQALAIDERRKPFAPTLWEQPREDAEHRRNWLQQAWFTGVHSNIGGGYPDSSLSDQTFDWMLKVVREKTRLEFDMEYVRGIVRPNPLGHLEDSMNDFFKALGEVDRRLGEIAVRARNPFSFTWEYIHESAKQRYESTKGTPNPWAPRGFLEYVGREETHFHDYLDDAIATALLEAELKRVEQMRNRPVDQPE